MRAAPWGAALAVVLGAAQAAAEQGPMLFSAFMRELAKDEAFVEAIIDRLGASPASSAMLGPLHQDRLRARVKQRDWESLDGFPTMTVDGIGRSVSLAAKMADAPAAPPDRRPRDDHLEALGIPTAGTPPNPADYLSDVGYGVEWGDALDPEAAARKPDSERLADLLTRLALNPRDGESGPRLRVQVGASEVATPVGLVEALEGAGHRFEIRDARYFANFGDLLLEGREVLTPFWMDTGIPVPGADHNLKVPAAHSQHELSLRGPVVNADVVFFFGIDGEAIFRTAETRDQSWTLGRVAARYQGERAHEALRILGEVIRTFAATRRAHPELPFGGYYALGVCNDANAMVELHMSGATTLYPLTVNASLFPDGGEVAALARALPIDRGAAARERVERVLGSLPTDDLSDLPFPDLRADLEAVRAAVAAGDEAWWGESSPIRATALALLLLAAGGAWAVRRHRAARG